MTGALIPFLAVWLILVVSPGPNFAVTAMAAMSGVAGAGLRTAAGVVSGIATWAIAGMVGLAVVMARAPALLGALRVAGALYLLSFAIRIAWRLTRPGARAAPPPGLGWRHGYATAIGNPATMVFFATAFLDLLPQDAGWSARAAVLAVTIAVPACWYALIGSFFGSAPVVALYRRMRPVFDGAIILVFIGLAIRVILPLFGA